VCEKNPRKISSTIDQNLSNDNTEILTTAVAAVEWNSMREYCRAGWYDGELITFDVCLDFLFEVEGFEVEIFGEVLPHRIYFSSFYEMRILTNN